MNEVKHIPNCENYENNTELVLKERNHTKINRNKKYHLLCLKRSLTINSVSHEEQENSYSTSQSVISVVSAFIPYLGDAVSLCGE